MSTLLPSNSGMYGPGQCVTIKKPPRDPMVAMTTYMQSTLRRYEPDAPKDVRLGFSSRLPVGCTNVIVRNEHGMLHVSWDVPSPETQKPGRAAFDIVARAPCAMVGW